MNEQENTFRVLTEEPLLVTSFWCRFGWHNWTKYREPEKQPEFLRVTQMRSCASCNIHHRKTIMRYY